jgi:hypothetical protein
MNIVISVASTILALALITVVCFRGDGGYYHRKRLDRMPWLWSFATTTGAFFTASLLTGNPVVLYFSALFAFFAGAGIGWAVLDNIWMSAVYKHG